MRLLSIAGRIACAVSLVVSFVPQALCAESAAASAPATVAAPVTAPLESEFAKQTDIYLSRGVNVPEGYVVDRSLFVYALSLPKSFARSLGELGANDRWLDIGAGEGQAVLDYCTSKYDMLWSRDVEGREQGKAQAVAVSIEDRRTTRWHKVAAAFGARQVEYLHGRTLQEYSREELGRFDLVTDVLGGFSYTRSLSQFMEKVLGLLDVDGMFYTLLQDVGAEDGSNRPHYAGSGFLTEIATPEGAAVSTCAWLKRIGCVQVTCEYNPNFTPQVEMYRIRKVCEQTDVPTLVLTGFEAGTPPERRFMMLPRLPGLPAQSAAR